jgi:hypothetical protein
MLTYADVCRLAPAPLDGLACGGRGNAFLATSASSAHTRRGSQHMRAQQLPRRGAYVSACFSIRRIRQHTSAYARTAATTRCVCYPLASMYQHTSAYVAYVSIRQHTSFLALLTVNPFSYPLASMYQHTSAYVAYVSIRQHTSFLALLTVNFSSYPHTSMYVSSD